MCNMYKNKSDEMTPKELTKVNSNCRPLVFVDVRLQLQC